MKRFNCLIAVAAVAMLVTACGGGSSKTSSGTSSGTSSQAAGTPANTGKVGGKLVIDNESGSTWTCQFNPFNPAVTLTSFGFAYESLQFVNILQSTKPTTINVSHRTTVFIVEFTDRLLASLSSGF